VLRFEVLLESGVAVLRGEGRVVGYKSNAFRDEPGLVMRFTRLDSKSKGVIDRAVAIRDSRPKEGKGEAPALEVLRKSSVPPPLPATTLSPT
ncbi:hypothetical protein ABTE39_19120, partial [Acinetobacter baumannii]